MFKNLFFQTNQLNNQFIKKWLECMGIHMDFEFGHILSKAYPSTISEYLESPKNNSSAKNSSDNDTKPSNEIFASQEQVRKVYSYLIESIM